jgi:hypothetical protein
LWESEKLYRGFICSARGNLTDLEVDLFCRETYVLKTDLGNVVAVEKPSKEFGNASTASSHGASSVCYVSSSFGQARGAMWSLRSAAALVPPKTAG